MILLGGGTTQPTRLLRAAATATAILIVDVTPATCGCTAGCYWCGRRISETVTLANYISPYEPPKDYAERETRACESLRIAARLEPLMRESQVLGFVPRRRQIRGATPRRFAFYQGLF